jgi:hypothetical protein
MDIIKQIEIRLEEITKEVLELVDNQKLNLTKKNQLMQPLVEEKKVLEDTLLKLKFIQNKSYSGICHL